MRNLTVPADLVAGIRDDRPSAERTREERRGASEQGRLAHAGLADHEHAAPAAQQVRDRLRCAGDCAPGPEREPDDLMVPVADAGDAVQRALDPGAVVV